jgi:hypothetical protein
MRVVCPKRIGEEIFSDCYELANLPDVWTSRFVLYAMDR